MAGEHAVIATEEYVASTNGHKPAPVAPPLPVETPAQVLDGGNSDFEPVILNLAYRGLKTLVVGQSKGGKLILLWARAAAAVEHDLRVLFMTEEPPGTIADKLRLFGLEVAEGFWLVRRTALPGARWETGRRPRR